MTTPVCEIHGTANEHDDGAFFCLECDDESSRKLVLLYLPMGLDEFCTITEAIARAFPDAKIGEPDEDGQVLVLRAASVSAGYGGPEDAPTRKAGAPVPLGAGGDDFLGAMLSAGLVL